MDDQRKRYGYPDDEGMNNESNNNEAPRREEASTKNSSYYYSYGPFQSIPNERDDQQTERPYHSRESQEVEVTAPRRLNRFHPPVSHSHIPPEVKGRRLYGFDEKKQRMELQPEA